MVEQGFEPTSSPLYSVKNDRKGDLQISLFRIQDYQAKS